MKQALGILTLVLILAIAEAVGVAGFVNQRWERRVLSEGLKVDTVLIHDTLWLKPDTAFVQGADVVSFDTSAVQRIAQDRDSAYLKLRPFDAVREDSVRRLYVKADPVARDFEITEKFKPLAFALAISETTRTLPAPALDVSLWQKVKTPAAFVAGVGLATWILKHRK